MNGQNSYTGKPGNAAKDVLPAWNDSTSGLASDTLKDRADILTTEVNTNRAGVAANAGDIFTNAGDIADNTQESADIRTTQGTAFGETDLGTFTGAIITDNTVVKTALQELETAVEAIPSGLVFQGTWNADTNTPSLSSGVGTQGHYYIVSVAGTTSLDGISDWGVGDWAVFSNGAWYKIDNSETVTSVNGQTGSVVLDTDDISEGTNKYNATHTGEVTGSVALTLDKTAITNKAAATPEAGDLIIFSDASDGGNLKTADVNDLLGSGGGSGVGGKNYLLDDAFNFEGGTVGGWSVYGNTPGIEPVDGIGFASTIDVNNTGYVDGGDSNGQVSDTIWRAQSFEAGFTGNYNKISVDGLIQSSASGSSIVMEILDFNSGVPDGSVLGTSTAIDISTLPSSVGTPVDFIFPTPVAVVSSTSYWWRVRTLASYSGSVDLYFDATDNYSGFTSSESSDSGASWADDVSGYDFDFTTYYESSDITFTAANDSSIRDAWVGEFSKSATNAQGQGISYDFSIDPADKNSSLYWSFDFLNLISLINDETITFWVRDITAGTNYRIIPKNGLSQFTSIFYTSENLNYRLMIHVSGTDGSAYDFSLDTMICGPDKIIDSPIITYIGKYVPAVTTSSGTPTNYTVSADYWRQDDRVVVAGKLFFTGAVGTWSSTFNFSGPPGLTRDASKGDSRYSKGTATVLDSGSNWFASHIDVSPDGSLFTVSSKASGGAYVNAAYFNSASIPIVWAVNDAIEFEVSYPVEEWANQSAVLSTTEMLNVTPKGETSGTTQSIATSTWTNLTVDTDVKDEQGMIASSILTAPRSDWYILTASLQFATNATGARGVKFYDVTNTQDLRIAVFQAPSPNFQTSMNIAKTVFLEKGQQIRSMGYQQSGGNLNAEGVEFTAMVHPTLSIYSVYGITDTVEIQAQPFVFPTFAAGIAQVITSFQFPSLGEWDVTTSIGHRVQSIALASGTDISTKLDTDGSASLVSGDAIQYGKNSSLSVFNGTDTFVQSNGSFTQKINVTDISQIYYLRHDAGINTTAADLRLDFYSIFARKVK